MLVGGFFAAWLQIGHVPVKKGTMVIEPSPLPIRDAGYLYSAAVVQ